MPAKDSFPSMGLRVSCLTCASGLLAAKVSRGAGLRASGGVRMVRRGFRALKTPEERLHCRRFSVGRHTMRESLAYWTYPGQILGKHCAFTEQSLSTFWAGLQNGYKLPTQRLQATLAPDFSTC